MRKTLQTGAVSAAVTLLLFGCATTAGAQAQSRFVFDFPGERLSQALRDVALQTGRDVIAPDDLVQARRAAPLSGTFTPEEAFQRLLRGSGLRYRLVGNSIIIERDPLSPGADVAGSADDKPADVVVTGTHVRGGPSTSPLIVLTRKDIDRTGATSIDELMRVVPQNSQGGVNKENSLVPLPDQDVTDHGAGINLRGLGQRATLVLLNGRRMAPSGSGSFVDVSLIPASALQRVEILTDGASAIYGSDAVGGVVNFVLRDRFEGLETSAQAGAATQGGGSEFLFSQTAGKNWGSGHGLAAYEFRAENEVRAGEREFTINLPNATYLLPRERKQSLLATLEQELAPGLRAGLTATFAHRATDRTVFQTISPLPVGVDAKATSATVSSELTYDLPNGWGVHVDGNYAFSKTTQRQTQPGGIPLVNARDVRNSIIEGEARIDGALIKLPGGPVVDNHQKCWTHFAPKSINCISNSPATISSHGRAATSARVTPNPGYVVIKPSGVRYEDLRPEHMVVVDLEGDVIEGTPRLPPTRRAISISIAIAPMCSASSTPTRPMPPRSPRSANPSPSISPRRRTNSADPIPCGGFALIGGEEIGKVVIESIGTSPAVLLKNHGVFTIGKNAEAAVKAAVMVEDVAHTTWLALQIGAAR